METINDRMEQIVEERFNGNKSAMAKSLGIDRATLSNYIGTKRRSKPSIDLVSKIIDKLDVNPYWFLLGRGELSGSSIVTGAGSQFNGANAHHNTLSAASAAADTLLDKIDMLQKSIEDKNQIISDKDKIISLLEGEKNNR